MFRSGRAVFAVVFAAVVLSPPDTQAANRGGHRGVGPAVHRPAGVAVQRPHVRRVARREFDRRGPERRFDRDAGYRRGFAGGYWPGYGLPVSQPLVAASHLGEADPAVDRDSFARVPVLAGIAPAPTPVPTVYTIAGPRDRPVTRAVRLTEAEPAGGQRTRFVHAETGALLLTVPRR